MARMTKAEKTDLAAKNKSRIDADMVIIRSNKCPQCGARIRRNSSMTGWYQCEQLGAEGFRKDPSKPPCSWQTFVS